MEDYIRSLHNLGGSTPAEHMKNFNKYAATLKTLPNEEVSTLLTRLHPQNYQEKSLLLRLLISHKKFPQALQMLHTNDGIISKKIVQNPEIVEFVASEYSAEDFVEKLCPNLSCTNRNLLLHKLGFNLEESDKYFKLIQSSYGRKTALNLLPRASESLIKSVLRDKFLCLNERDLLFISKRFPDFLTFYFKNTGRKFNSRSRRFKKHLLEHDHGTLKLLVKGDVPRFGKRSAKKFIEICKEAVLNDPQRFQDYDHVVHQALNESEYSEYFRKLFPKDVDDVRGWDVVFRNLGHVKLGNRAKIFYESFENVFGEAYQETKFSLGAYSDVQSTLLSVLPLEEREKFDLDLYSEALSIEEGIQRMKEKLDVSAGSDSRREILWNLVNICKVNKSPGALLGVLEYAAVRIKNDNFKVREKLMDSLSFNFDLKLLGDDHWFWIEQMLLKFEENGEHFYEQREFLKVLILRKLRAGVDCKKEIAACLKAQIWSSHWSFVDPPEHEKTCILLLPELLAAIPEAQNDKMYPQQFFKTIAIFNRKHPQHAISFFAYPEILEEVTDFRYSSDVLKSIFRFKALDESQEETKTKFIEHCLANVDSEIDEDWLVWVLLNRPDLIGKHAESLLGNLEGCPRFFFEVSKMHYTGLPALFAAISLKLLERPSELEHSGPLEFLCRANYSLNIETVKGIEKPQRFQKMLFKALLNSDDPCQIATTAFTHANLDNLQSALQPLYFSFSRIQEKNLEAHLDQLLSRSVSFKKHCFYLALTATNLEFLTKLLEESAKTEKSVSVRKFIFACALRAFQETGDEKLFGILVGCLGFVCHYDAESVESLTSSKLRIPELFVPRYVEAVWKVLKSHKPYQKFRVLKLVSSDNISGFSEDLGGEILRASLLEKHNFYREDTVAFLYNYLVFSEDISKRFGAFCEAVKQFSGGNGFGRSKTCELLEDLCVKLVKNKEENLQGTVNLIKHILESSDQIPLEPELQIFLDLYLVTLTNPENFCDHLFERSTYFLQKFGNFHSVYLEVATLLVEICCPNFRQENLSKLNLRLCETSPDLNFQQLLADAFLRPESEVRFVKTFREKYFSTN